MPGANFGNRSQNHASAPDACPPADQTGVAPDAGVMERRCWRHQIRALDRKHRVTLSDVARAGDVFDARLHGGRWVLRPAQTGVHVDARRRLLVPVGVHYALDLDGEVGVSWTGRLVVVWAPARLDGFVEDVR